MLQTIKEALCNHTYDSVPDKCAAVDFFHCMKWCGHIKSVDDEEYLNNVQSQNAEWDIKYWELISIFQILAKNITAWDKLQQLNEALTNHI